MREWGDPCVDYENLTASDHRLVQDTERTAPTKMEMACEEGSGILEAMNCDCSLYCHDSDCPVSDRVAAPRFTRSFQPCMQSVCRCGEAFFFSASTFPLMTRV